MANFGNTRRGGTQFGAGDRIAAGPPPAGGGSGADRVAAGPPGAEGDLTARRPIGVPVDYVAQTPSSRWLSPETQGAIRSDTGNIFAPGPSTPFTAPGAFPVKPTYYDGDEWKPGTMSPAAVAELQADLVRAGLLDPKDYSRGYWDVPSSNAYKQVLASANGAGRDARDMLGHMVSNPPQGAAKAERLPEPLVIRLSNREDLREVLNQTVSKYTGGVAAISDEDMAAFTDAFQDVERTTQRKAYEAGGSGLPGGPGGEVEDVPSPATAARAKVFAERPRETKQYSFIEDADAFMSLLNKAGV